MSKYLFKAPCPIIGCKNSNKDKVFQWYHAGCGKRMYITSEAYLICENGHQAEMIDWNFKCENHDYEQTCHQGLLLALSVLSTLQTIDYNWICNTNDKLTSQFRKAKNNEYNAYNSYESYESYEEENSYESEDNYENNNSYISDDGYES